jgi:uncharacterized membrane protein YphA (DoxX/SURF4 family)
MSTRDKRMQFLAYALGAAHVAFGAVKLAALPAMVEQFRGWQLPPWMMYFVGAAQLVAGVCFFLKNLRLPASFSMGLVMIGATVTLLATGQERAMAPLTIVIALLCFAVAGHRLFRLAHEIVARDAANAPRAASVPAAAV